MPHRLIFKYGWRHPLIAPVTEKNESASVRIGDEVWVKPPNARCTTKWKKGHVTGITSRNNVSVDGMPRHVLDIRRIVDPQCTAEELDEEVVVEVPEEVRLQFADDVEGMQGENGSSGEGDNTVSDDVGAPDNGTRPRRARRRPVWLDGYASDFDDVSE